jgi:hypothetical protein
VIVEQWAHPVDPPDKHPAGTFGKRAQLAGWTVEYRAARGPLTVRRRPDEPDERGKYALVETTELVDTLGVRAAHPDGRRIAAWWVGRAFSEGWAAGPRRNARPLGIRALTAYLTEIEEENVNETTTEHRPMVETWAAEAIADGALMDNISDPVDGYLRGYHDGYARSSEEHGDAYGEGYAAGLAAVVGRVQVWVKTRKRLDALRPGDVILGKGDRWWIVDANCPDVGGQRKVIAYHRDEPKTIQADGQRKVDVVEPIALADALAALRDLGATPIADEDAVA